MKEAIIVPQMGESVTEAGIGQILKPSGSQVEENEEIIELETEKVNQVLYAPVSGVVEWSVSEGDTVKIGDTIGQVDAAGKATATPAAPKKEEATAPTPKPTPPPSGENARMQEAEFIASLQEREAPPPAPAPKKEKPAPQPVAKPSPTGRPETRRKMSRIRKVIAGRLVDALQTSAMLTTFNEVDMSAVMALRARYKEEFQKKHAVKLGFMSFFVKAVVDALQALPDINSYIDGEDIVAREYYDIGIAVGTEKGLVVPVVRDCDTLTFAGIESAIVDYATKAREGKLAISDMEGGGFTITNGGTYGSLLSTPILNPPQSGILGMHNIVKRPVAINDEVVIRPMMYIALSYDHRIVDGKEAVTFLVHLKQILEDPAKLLIDPDGKL